MQNEPAIILFDGVCNLCNGAIRFILERDACGQFRFATTESQTAKSLVQEYKITDSLDETFVLIKDGTVYCRSDAALVIAGELNRPWRWFNVLLCLPAGFRDGIYDRIAQNRYRWFGRREVCMVPGDEIRHRFLD
ncbi:MAG: DUF393 domain-containing protein [Pseudomonadales bacterium]|nr:DUF393 domain-containing protein [Pseudomonadales bacterium]MBO6563599.1 DUF393 domain-containing protein [Pseudomonadales bacterium]MBO6596741.1 DUF393 domain-containing protein [Pseudomonadales bacterium]MBO6823270.1 DUF393 domain-containing protein [Pseudomonadales bacterium]